ncbi:MAG TPA: prolyl oligopeptidase family serine peptidase [Gemmatimonadales bacterium]|nr:prolyl oligopeptidase family serine peptidase [Gemmatimonadales bacterium]
MLSLRLPHLAAARSRACGLPLVLLVHGGPWERDVWAYDPEVQLLANRGYAVLQVNYRGSTGYGKAYLNAGNREWAGKMRLKPFWRASSEAARSPLGRGSRSSACCAERLPSVACTPKVFHLPSLRRI